MKNLIPGTVSLIVLTTSLWRCTSPQALYDYDTLAIFSAYRTFSWREAVTDGPQLDTFAATIVRREVEAALSARGLRPVSAGGDLSVVYYIGFGQPVNVPASGYAYWPDRWAWGGYYLGAAQYIYGRDALIIDLVDDESEQLVWRGSLEKVFRPGPPDRIAADIRMAVDSILARYPPPPPPPGG